MDENLFPDSEFMSARASLVSFQTFQFSVNCKF